MKYTNHPIKLLLATVSKISLLLGVPVTAHAIDHFTLPQGSATFSGNSITNGSVKDNDTVIFDGSSYLIADVPLKDIQIISKNNMENTLYVDKDTSFSIFESTGNGKVNMTIGDHVTATLASKNQGSLNYLGDIDGVKAGKGILSIHSLDNIINPIGQKNSLEKIIISTNTEANISSKIVKTNILDLLEGGSQLLLGCEANLSASTIAVASNQVNMAGATLLGEAGSFVEGNIKFQNSNGDFTLGVPQFKGDIELKNNNALILDVNSPQTGLRKMIIDGDIKTGHNNNNIILGDSEGHASDYIVKGNFGSDNPFKEVVFMTAHTSLAVEGTSLNIGKLNFAVPGAGTLTLNPIQGDSIYKIDNTGIRGGNIEISGTHKLTLEGGSLGTLDSHGNRYPLYNLKLNSKSVDDVVFDLPVSSKKITTKQEGSKYIFNKGLFGDKLLFEKAANITLSDDSEIGTIDFAGNDGVLKITGQGSLIGSIIDSVGSGEHTIQIYPRKITNDLKVDKYPSINGNIGIGYPIHLIKVSKDREIGANNALPAEIFAEHINAKRILLEEGSKLNLCSRQVIGDIELKNNSELTFDIGTLEFNGNIKGSGKLLLVNSPEIKGSIEVPVQLSKNCIIRNDLKVKSIYANQSLLHVEKSSRLGMKGGSVDFSGADISLGYDASIKIPANVTYSSTSQLYYLYNGSRIGLIDNSEAASSTLPDGLTISMFNANNADPSIGQEFLLYKGNNLNVGNINISDVNGRIVFNYKVQGGELIASVNNIIPITQTLNFERVQRELNLVEQNRANLPRNIEQVIPNAPLSLINDFARAPLPVQKEMLEKLQPSLSSSPLTRSITSAVSNTAHATLANSEGAVLNRMQAITNPTPEIDGVASGSIAEKDEIWVSIFTTQDAQKLRNGDAGYKSSTLGGTFGYDLNLNDQTIIGGTVTTAHTDIDQKDYKLGDKVKANTLMVGLYGLYEFSQNIFVQGIFNIGNTKVESSSKRISYGRKATAYAEYEIFNYGLTAITGYNYFYKNFLLTPTIGLQYNKFSEGEYTEAGVVGQNFKVLAKIYDKVTGKLGLRISKSINFYEYKLIPELNFNINHDINNKAVQVQQVFQGTKGIISSYSAKPAATSYNIGLGFSSNMDNIDIDLNYNLELKSKFVGHQGSFKIRVNL